MNYSRKLSRLLNHTTLFARQKWRVLLAIFVSLTLALTTTYVLESVGKTGVDYYESPPQFTISNETRSFLIQIHSTGPSYFASVGRIYIHISSTYAEVLEIFEVEMSLDNTSWVRVPLLPSRSNDHTKFADLGLVDLDKLLVVIYGRYYIPEQTVMLPPNVTKDDVLNSLQGNIEINREPAPRDTTIKILVIVTLFGVFLRLTDLLFLRRESTTRQGPH